MPLHTPLKLTYTLFKFFDIFSLPHTPLSLSLKPHTIATTPPPSLSLLPPPPSNSPTPQVSPTTVTFTVAASPYYRPNCL
ncbi:hypothetical protein Scep_024036 [Stephania cephalantha]|uniref:Uncharacterized protein n=1 Tax=Stephania cephalantha TaxID=152367 RepID=A0AAP0HXW3_9MAGN